jgi:hypothetical protein
VLYPRLSSAPTTPPNNSYNHASADQGNLQRYPGLPCNVCRLFWSVRTIKTTQSQSHSKLETRNTLKWGTHTWHGVTHLAIDNLRLTHSLHKGLELSMSMMRIWRCIDYLRIRVTASSVDDNVFGSTDFTVPCQNSARQNSARQSKKIEKGREGAVKRKESKRHSVESTAHFHSNRSRDGQSTVRAELARLNKGS